MSTIKERIQILAETHPDMCAKEIARITGSTVGSVKAIRSQLGITKGAARRNGKPIFVDLSNEYHAFCEVQAIAHGVKTNEYCAALLNDAIAEAMEEGE